MAVNVALRVGGQFIAAAVADPINDEILWTDSVSAFLRAGGQDTPLRKAPAARYPTFGVAPGAVGQQA